MERSEAEKKARSLIAKKLGLEDKNISNGDKIEEICRDSIQIFELVMEFEKELGKKIEYKDICEIETVGDIVLKMEKEL